MIRLYIIFILIFCFSTSQATSLSNNTKVYLATLGPGDELYSGFGHSSIWFQDSTLQMDRAYNYGTFNFSPDFYMQFVRGKLDYMLSVHEFKYLLQDAQDEDRYLILQELNLTTSQKEKLFELLEENYRPENKFYRYDFFYDNCSSRIRDMLSAACKDSLKYDLRENKNLSFRQLIDLYLHDKRFQDFWMDIGLGAPADVKATPAQYMFLPEFLKSAFDKAKLVNDNGNKPMVKITITLYKQKHIGKEPVNYTLWFCWILCAGVVIYTWLTITQPRAGRIFDLFWLIVTGVLGWVLIGLWFFTDHSVTAFNYDLLWAIPFHLIVAFFFFSNHHKILLIYFLASEVFCLILLFGWSYLPEELNTAVFPLVVLTFWRWMKVIYDLFKKIQHKKNYEIRS